jgi:branched-chain amino acid aminotransferase
MKQYCYFNGKIVELEKAGISPYDLGIIRGYAFFDVMRTANGKPFLLKEHFLRLKKSAKEMKLSVPFSLEEFEVAILRLLKLNKLEKGATIRTVITGGLSADSFSIGEKPTAYILAENFHAFPEVCYRKGAKLLVLENSLSFTMAKITANYGEAIKAQELRKKKKAHEILYVKDGKIFECSTSNIFIVKNGEIVTPKEGMLFGTTRALILKRHARKFKIVEREVTLKELEEADEVFLTATNKGVVPVVEVGEKKISDGKIGAISRELMKAYQDLILNY